MKWAVSSEGSLAKGERYRRYLRPIKGYFTAIIIYKLINENIQSVTVPEIVQSALVLGVDQVRSVIKAPV